MEAVAKLSDQPHAAVMGQVVFIESKIYFSSAFGHFFQNTPWGHFAQTCKSALLTPIFQRISPLHDQD